MCWVLAITENLYVNICSYGIYQVSLSFTEDIHSSLLCAGL